MLLSQGFFFLLVASILSITVTASAVSGAPTTPNTQFYNPVADAYKEKPQGTALKNLQAEGRGKPFQRSLQ
jgi:hypothetical protein